VLVLLSLGLPGERIRFRDEGRSPKAETNGNRCRDHNLKVLGLTSMHALAVLSRTKYPSEIKKTLTEVVAEIGDQPSFSVDGPNQ
jgi:hypothetical protein